MSRLGINDAWPLLTTHGGVITQVLVISTIHKASSAIQIRQTHYHNIHTLQNTYTMHGCRKNVSMRVFAINLNFAQCASLFLYLDNNISITIIITFSYNITLLNCGVRTILVGVEHNKFRTTLISKWNCEYFKLHDSEICFTKSCNSILPVYHKVA